MKRTTFAWMGRRRPRSRRRGASRLFVLGAAFAVSTAGAPARAAVRADTTQSRPDRPADRVAFDIPAGSIAEVVAAFQTATGIAVTLANDLIRDLPSPGVRGTFTPRQALERLLTGTGVGVVFGTGGATLDLRLSEYVTVEGRPAVASPKFTSPLVDTPQTISVIPSRVFNEQGAQNLTDVLRNTPGITFNAGENGFASGTSNFSLRGMDATSSIFVDGARDSGNYFRDVFNVEQVEVVKGPSGENGRGSGGGYVNLTTKVPQLESFQRVTLSYGFDEYGSENRPRTTADLNQRLTDGVALRVNALWQDGGVPGRETAERNNWGVAPSLAIGLGGPTRATLSYQHIDQQDLPDWGVPGALIEGMVAYNAAAGGSEVRDRFYGHTSDYDDVTSDAAVVRVEHDFSRTVGLSNQTRWSDTEREALYAIPTGFTPATGTATTQRQGYRRENTAISNFTNLGISADTGAVRHAVSAGVELSHEGSSANRYPTNGLLGNPGATPIGRPDPNRPLAGLVGLVPVQTAEVTINTVAGYLYDTARFGDHWEVTGGVRVERYDVSLESRTAAGAPQGPDGYSREDTTLNGKIGVVYMPSPAGSIYGSFGSNVLPPASFLSNPDISRDGDNAFPGWSAGQNSAASKVQRLTNIEVGAKWNVLDQRLSASAAAFRTERSNIAMAGTVDGVANTFAGYGQQFIRGVELGAIGNLTREWTLLAGLLVMDSERRHGPEVDAARLAANPGDYGDRVSTSGDQLAFTPRVTGNLWTTYRLPMGLTIGGGLQYMGESYLGRPDDAERIIPNGRAGTLPAYTVVNALATYAINRNLSLRFNADNLTDRFYAVSANWGGSRVTLGPPRSFQVSADVRF